LEQTLTGIFLTP